MTFYVGHCVLTVKEILPHANMLFSGQKKLKPKNNIKNFFGDVVFSLTPCTNLAEYSYLSRPPLA
jgi:hypothetical protein